MNQQSVANARTEAMLRRAIEVESVKTIELGSLRKTISILEIHRTLGIAKPPGLDGLHATAKGLESDLKALRQFQADHPQYRPELANGLLGDVA